ncbi:MAG: SDR family NAD(P)-dependent oxidoreductase [Nostoc desertorum CM1-VF14]|jgi:nucleoside-diphosphate-sugar epimerase|nr:SDR family NAD(P)-dependent oxidoreductase [Nostoc desertorum CM1-VF14]
MKVFLTGATGNIGSAIAHTLIAQGHKVIGLARSEEAANKLQNQGIEPHLGDLNDTQSIARGAKQAEATIHTAWTQGAQMINTEQNTIATILEALDSSSKTFIYTSGMMIYGDTGNKIADENTPINAPDFLTWRVPIEQAVLAATSRNIRSIVVRPALVYTKGRGFIARQISSAWQEGTARCPGTGKNFWSIIHVDDLAALYVCALEKAPAGTIFNGAAESVSIRTLMETISHAAGTNDKIIDWSQQEARQVLGPFADALWMNIQVSGAKAREMLGWEPQISSVLEVIAHDFDIGVNYKTRI